MTRKIKISARNITQSQIYVYEIAKNDRVTDVLYFFFFFLITHIVQLIYTQFSTCFFSNCSGSMFNMGRLLLYFYFHLVLLTRNSHYFI